MQLCHTKNKFFWTSCFKLEYQYWLIKSWNSEKLEKNNVTERSLLESHVVVYYLSFIKEIAWKAKCLFNPTGKNLKLNWVTKCNAAFEKLKKKLISAPILWYPDVNASDYVLNINAINNAAGAVLSRIQN